MDFGNRTKARSKANNTSNGGPLVDERYPHRLQLYTTPPFDQITLQEFEELAVERLKGTSVQGTHKFDGPLR